MRLIEHKTALYGIQIVLRTNIDTDEDFQGDIVFIRSLTSLTTAAASQGRRVFVYFPTA